VLEAMLLADQTGADFSNGTGEKEPEAKEETPAKPIKVDAGEAPPAEGEKKLSVVEQLRARAAAQKAKAEAA